MTAVQLAYYKFRNRKACAAIDRKFSGVAPEVKPVSITGNQTSLLPTYPRRPTNVLGQVKAGSFEQNYVKMVRLGASGRSLVGAMELSKPAFEVCPLLIDRAKVSRKRYMLDTPSPSSLVPDFSGDQGMQLAPYKIVDGRKVWLP